eukprot:5122864-Pleurochrysis_carterae.AAC.1
MDRGALNQPLLLCPNYEPVLIVIHALASLLAVISILGVCRAVQDQVLQAGLSLRASYSPAPAVVVLAGLVSTVFLLLYFGLKLAFLTCLLGIACLIRTGAENRCEGIHCRGAYLPSGQRCAGLRSDKPGWTTSS